MAYMIEQIAQRYRTQAIGALNQADVGKFSDAAKPGNYATVWLRLAKQVGRKLLRQFDDKRLERVVRRILEQTNRTNSQAIYAAIEKKIGISAKELLASEGLQTQLNALILETTQWAAKLRDDTLEHFTATTLRAMVLGESLEDIQSRFEEEVGKRKDHAKFVARTQIANYNSLATKIRAQNLGIERAVWVTAQDERVRTCHIARNGKEFDLAEGLYSSCDGKTILPGVDYQCRCTYDLIIPEE